jgi:hypothetical protein
MDDILDSTPDVTIETVMGYLARWPASKEDVLYYARMNTAPQVIINTLMNLPDGIYQNPKEFDYALRQVI